MRRTVVRVSREPTSGINHQAVRITTVAVAALDALILDLLYLSTSSLWWQAVAAILGVTSSNPLRNNSRCTWRHREGARYVYNTAIRRAFSPLRPCGSVPADVHGCPRGVAPLRRPLAIRDTPVTHTGEETAQSPHYATGCATHPVWLKISAVSILLKFLRFVVCW